MAKEGKVSISKLPSTRSIPETNIIQQILEATIPVKINDLLETLLQKLVAITRGNTKEDGKEEAKVVKYTNTLFTIEMGMTPVVVEMEIMGCKLTNAIMNGG